MGECVTGYLDELLKFLSEFKSVTVDYEGQEETAYPYAMSLITAEKVQTLTDEFNSSYSIETLPKNVCLRKSGISKNEYGIWSDMEIPKGTRFGPYEGIILCDREDVNENGCSLKELEDEQTDYFVDIENENIENWLYYVNFASEQTQQNLIILKCDENIYYQTIKDVLPNTELLAWYETKSPIEIQSEDTVSDMNVPDSNDIHENKPVHKKPKQAERPYNCDICGKRITTKGNMKIHQRLHTGETPFVCDICEVRFRSKRSLIAHQYVHTGVKPFTCDECGKGFQHSYNLKLHQRIHTGEKPYSCNICGKLFTWINELKSHQHIHTEEKPYTCNICSRGYTSSSGLKIHQRAHTGEKPYICEICGKSFSRNSSLKEHKYTHEPKAEEPHICDLCGKGFMDYNSWSMHQCIPTEEEILRTSSKMESNLKSQKDETIIRLSVMMKAIFLLQKRRVGNDSDEETDFLNRNKMEIKEYTYQYENEPKKRKQYDLILSDDKNEKSLFIPHIQYI